MTRILIAALAGMGAGLVIWWCAFRLEATNRPELEFGLLTSPGVTVIGPGGHPS